MREAFIVLGVFVAGLTMGYLVGGIQRETVVTTATPNNYDPARTLCNDMLKAEREQTQACWRQVVTALEERTNGKEKAH